MIDSYFIEAHESGIIELIINTTERCLGYHRCSDELFKVSDGNNSEELEVNLPLQPNMRYSVSSLQEKEQIIFYYIPLYLIMDKWDKLKERYDSKRNNTEIS